MKRMLFLVLFILSLNLHAQTFTVAISPENPPFTFQADNGKLFFGFEIDIMDEICRRINAQCIYKPMVVGTILNQFMTGEIDFAIAALILTSEPSKDFIFTLPYLQSGGQFMALTASKITTPAAIRHQTVGVRRGTLSGGTFFKDLILKLYDQQLNVKEYPTMHALLAALNNKEVDVIFANEMAVKYWYNSHKDFYKLIGTAIPAGNGYAIMATKKYAAEINQMDHALRDMMADGTYLKFYSSYFIPMSDKRTP